MYAMHQIGLTAHALPLSRAPDATSTAPPTGAPPADAGFSDEAAAVLLSAPGAVLQLLASSQESYAQLNEWRAEREAAAEARRAEAAQQEAAARREQMLESLGEEMRDGPRDPDEAEASAPAIEARASATSDAPLREGATADAVEASQAAEREQAGGESAATLRVDVYA